MTTSVSVEVLAECDLGAIGDEIGSGGQAVVYDLPELRLPDASGRLVYKRYRDGQEPHVSLMRQLIGRRLDLTDPQRRRLDTLATWPLRVVLDRGLLRGVVLARIPDAFHQEAVLPSGRSVTIVREVQHLFVDAVRCQRIGMPYPDPEQRLRICRDFAAALDFLHTEADVVFGDINARNEVFRLDAEPMVMFVDCDAVRRRGAVGSQLNTPDWEPSGTTSQNRESDCYKLGLFILRCLTPGSQCSTGRDPAAAVGVLDDDGVDLLRRAVNGLAHERPPPHEWWRYLSHRLGEMTELPELVSASADRTLVAAGETVTVRWAARHGQTVEVSSAGRVVVATDCDGESGVVEVEPIRTGRLTVTVRNNLGRSSSATGPVAVLDPLPREHLLVPMPGPPSAGLSLWPLPEVWSALPSVPGIPLDPVAGPPVPSGTAVPTIGAPPPFPLTDCPIDIAAFLRDSPDLTFTNWENEQ